MISSSRAKAKLLEGLKTTLVPSSSPSLCSGRDSATSPCRSPGKRRIHFISIATTSYKLYSDHQSRDCHWLLRWLSSLSTMMMIIYWFSLQNYDVYEHFDDDDGVLITLQNWDIMMIYCFSLQNYEGRRLTPANLFVHISTKEQPIGKITNSTDIQWNSCQINNESTIKQWDLLEMNTLMWYFYERK